MKAAFFKAMRALKYGHISAICGAIPNRGHTYCEEIYLTAKAFEIFGVMYLFWLRELLNAECFVFK